MTMSRTQWRRSCPRWARLLTLTLLLVAACGSALADERGRGRASGRAGDGGLRGDFQSDRGMQLRSGRGRSESQPPFAEKQVAPRQPRGDSSRSPAFSPPSHPNTERRTNDLAPSMRTFPRVGADNAPLGRFPADSNTIKAGNLPSLNPSWPARGGRSAARDDAISSERLHFEERYRRGQLRVLTEGQEAKKLRLDEQYRLYSKGDVARQLGLHQRLAEGTVKPPEMRVRIERPDRPIGPKPPASPGSPRDDRDRDRRDWDHHHFPYHGRVSPAFRHHCFDFVYVGPAYYPHRCWYPHWGPWVAWSWHYYCHPLWDPRPIWCRPIIYVAAPVWVYWEVPVWTPLPVVVCGTWVDVPPVVVAPSQLDLQLLAVRFVDPGHPEENLGPRYRVWFRNNSQVPITQPFNVTLLASADDRLTAQLPQAGVRVTAMEAGDVQSVDVRLPAEVAGLSRDAEGKPAPFTTLHVLVDANREISETSKANNGAKIARAEILPVDPASFEAQPKTVPPGGEVLLAGEGFGPEPGEVLVQLGGLELQGEIRGWYDLGVRVAVPNLPLAAAAPAELVVVRGDGAAANPVSVTIAPGVEGPQLVPPADQ